MSFDPCDRAPARLPVHHRIAIPLAALALFGLVALLRLAGLSAVGNGALRLLGVVPGPFPFLDTHAVLAAAQCQRRGIDVYLSNPCDVFGRTHVYSPLWLSLVPPGLGTAATPWVGAGLDLLFIASLAWLLRPRTGRELAIFAVAVFSPTTVYALERANNELVIFLLVLVAGVLQARSRAARLCSYALIVGAALLKYFPAVLLSLAARERRRDALCVAGGAMLAAALLAVAYRDVLGTALANIPSLSYYTDSFSARNLPFGLATGLPMLADPRPFAIGLFAVMTGLALVWLRRAVTLLDRAGLVWTGAEARFAAIGGLLLTGCFFAGQNVDYRGIHFLFALPGLLLLRASAAPPAARRFLSRLVAAALLLMWEEFFRQALLAAFAAQPGDRVAMVFWVGREWLWWWTISGLAAVALCYLKRLPLLQTPAAMLTRLIGVGRGSIGIAAPGDQ
ncbi:MAG TPA: glycosyltransferase 87 family protein [Stellaceae bacterium]|nr:glycosyltransferase 87 family protein [Stellaceae bacterium]